MVGDFQDYQIVGDGSCGLLTTRLLGIFGKFGDGKLLSKSNAGMDSLECQPQTTSIQTSWGGLELAVFKTMGGCFIYRGSYYPP